MYKYKTCVCVCITYMYYIEEKTAQDKKDA